MLTRRGPLNMLRTMDITAPKADMAAIAISISGSYTSIAMILFMVK